MENKISNNNETAFRKKIVSLEAELDLLKTYIYNNSSFSDKANKDQKEAKLSEK